MANEEAKIDSMKFGAYVLDNFIAPKLSQLKSCSAPDLETFESPFASYLL